MINKVSKRWSDGTKDLINNSKLNLVRVYDNTFIDPETINILSSHSLPETCHCDFCGQKIKYVSVLEFDKNKNLLYFQIGKECMSYLFDYGMRINGLEHAKSQIESAVKKLMKKSSERARVEKYKKEFDTYLKWLDSLDKTFIAKSNFLSFINNRLRTGDGVVTMKMMAVLDNMIKKYTQHNTSHLDETKPKLLQKIDAVIEEMKIVYDNFEANSYYKFVKSVREGVEKYGNATTRQLEALNNVFKAVKSQRKKLAEKMLNTAFSPAKQTDDIPW